MISSCVPPGLDSFSESDFTDSCSESDIVEAAEDPSCREARGEGLGQPRDGGNSQLEPKVGMVFRSEDEAYEFYNEYAKRKGFSVRKGHIARRSDGSVQSRSYLCSKEGTRQKHSSHVTRKPRALERTNCMARIEYKVDKDSIWVVSKVILDHNHHLASASTSHMLKSQRKASNSKTRGSDEADRARGEAADMGGDHGVESVGFVNRYRSSCLSTKRSRDLERGDAQMLFEFLKGKKLEDPSFFYAIQLDEMDRMANFFWADLQSVVNFSYFGDVVSLDTLYRLNKSEIPFALFTGVNHHKQICVFGAAVLLDESVESYVWLFNAFMAAMSGRQPRTIFTDHCASIANGISMVLTNTCHRICLWHILQNAEKLLSSVYNSKPNFSKEFKTFLYEAGSKDDFYSGWNNLITKYDLAGNQWLQELFGIQEKWALVYQGNSFSATMSTPQWSESMLNLFKLNLNRKLPLSRFIELYQRALIQLHEKELLEDYKSRTTKPVLLVDMPMLNEAAESYTRLIYTDFEDQFKSQIACVCQPVAIDETLCTFRVSLPNEHCYWLVEFHPTDAIVLCSCKKFEIMGVLCMHALKVLNINNVLNLPSQYILKRWTKFANEGPLGSEGPATLALHYSQVYRKMITAAEKIVASKNALEVFERGFDKLIMEVENVIHGPPKIVESESQIAQLHAITEKKKKRITHYINNSTEANTSHDLVQSKGCNVGGLDQMAHGPSHLKHYDQKVVSSLHDAIPSHPVSLMGGASLCTNGDTADPSIASEGAGNSKETRIAAKDSVGGPMQIMRGQLANLNNCTVETYPNVVVYRFHSDQPIHFTVPNQRKSMSHNHKVGSSKGN
ncbi:putative transcription factor FAR family [Dioscorea sansibarensis]